MERKIWVLMITWNYKAFDELTPHELYACLQLRSEVFVVEQNCIFPDLDGKDKYSHHIMGWHDNKLVAYARILPPGISYVESAIGRIVTSPTARGKGIGRELVRLSIETLYTLHGKAVIRIGAQLYLQGFYESFGFRQTGPIYLEDNIEHIEMLLFIKA
jgi:ElaA protein